MDPRWIKDNPQRVVGAMMASPAIHRHRTASAATVVRAAQRVVGRYESDAAKIWNDQPTGQQLYNRFVAFHGFGPKKASFATIFLSGSMFVPVRRMDEAEPTVDFRVERFMHLTGIVPSCDHDLIRMAIRRAMPADGPDRDTWYSEVDRGMSYSTATTITRTPSEPADCQRNGAAGSQTGEMNNRCGGATRPAAAGSRPESSAGDATSEPGTDPVRPVAFVSRPNPDPPLALVTVLHAGEFSMVSL